MKSHPLNVPQLFTLLLRADQELAAETRSKGCRKCGGHLHCGDFPRKPRGCPSRFVKAYSRRFSFDCASCRARTTPPSVRFLGRRVYLAVVLALVGERHTPRARAWLSRVLHVPVRTVERWRHWWREHFPATPLWQALSGRFLPRIALEALPGSLLERIAASERTQQMLRLLKLLSPLSVPIQPARKSA